MLAHSGGDAPPELWDGISSRLGVVRAGDDNAGHGVPFLSGSSSSGSYLEISDLNTARSRSNAARSRAATLATLAARAGAVAAAVVIIFLGVQVGSLNHRIGQLDQASQRNGINQAVEAALVDPSARHIELSSTASTWGASPSEPVRSVLELVVMSSGSSFAVNQGMPALPSDETYQLWGILRGKAVSLGLLGSRPDQVALFLEPGAGFTAYAITAEHAGGVVSSTHSPVAETTV
jgi:hypothetical protein